RRRARRRARKKSWCSQRSVSSSLLLPWYQVVWRSQRTTCTSTMAAVRKRRQRK
ncbi:hypothetical protein M9458_032821, partial [Cirrhinus mrigala]